MGITGTPRSAEQHCGTDLIEELTALRHTGISIKTIAERYGTTPGYVVALTDLFDPSLARRTR